MSESNLVEMKVISPCATNPRQKEISRITIHCFVGMWTMKEMLTYFANPNNKVSCNYVIDRDGHIGLCEPEGTRAWCSSNGDNDHRSINIEVASGTIEPYRITDDSYTSLIDLCADICRRNGKKELIWISNKENALSYNLKKDQMLITVHRWFANKACPGDYIYGYLYSIASEVNTELDMVNNEYLSEEMLWATHHRIFQGFEDGQIHPDATMTRDQCAKVLYRFYKEFVEK